MILPAGTPAMETSKKVIFRSVVDSLIFTHSHLQGGFLPARQFTQKIKKSLFKYPEYDIILISKVRTDSRRGQRGAHMTLKIPTLPRIFVDSEDEREYQASSQRSHAQRYMVEQWGPVLLHYCL